MWWMVVGGAGLLLILTIGFGWALVQRNEARKRAANLEHDKQQIGKAVTEILQILKATQDTNDKPTEWIKGRVAVAVSTLEGILPEFGKKSTK